MSTEDFNKRMEETKKQLNVLRKDINYRDEQSRRGEATYESDAEIKGQFIQIGETIDHVGKLMRSYIAAPKDFNLSQTEISKRQKIYDQNVTDRNNLQKIYDGLFEKKNEPKINLISPETTNDNRPDLKKLTTKQIQQVKKKQEDEQDQAIDELIGTVKQLKSGGKAIGGQLDDQDALLNQLDRGLDRNTEKMGMVRRNMMKLLDKSSNCCLGIIIVLEIAAVIAILIVWK